MTRVTVQDAKTHPSRLLDEVERGGEVVITRLAPIARQPGRFKGRFTLGPEFFEPLSEEDLRLWEGGGD